MTRLPPLLFDLDGTLIDSRRSVDRHWSRWANRHSLDAREVLPFVYGHRSIDTIRHFTPTANAVVDARRIDQEQASDTNGVRAIEAAPALLATLDSDRWGIVTSSTREIATARLRAAGLDLPSVLVSADDVEAGKPSPGGYLLAAERIGFRPSACVAVEDAPTGIDAARSAGMFTIAVTTTHSPDQVAHADLVIADLADLTAAWSSVTAR